MNTSLPPERDLPDADAMLARILDDEPARRPWLLPAAAAVTLVALGAGGAALFLRPSRSSVAPAAMPGPVSASQVETPVVSANTPSPTRSAPRAAVTPSTDAAGVPHLDGPGTVVFKHFRVTVGDAPATLIDGRWGRHVKVCVVELGPDPIDGKTTVSWAPWTMTQGGEPSTPVDGTRYLPGYPARDLFAPGECATGWLTFPGDPKAATTVTYANSDYGETAVWHLPAAR